MRRLFPKRGTSDGEPRVIVNLIVECQVVSSPEERRRILAERNFALTVLEQNTGQLNAIAKPRVNSAQKDTTPLSVGNNPGEVR